MLNKRLLSPLHGWDCLVADLQLKGCPKAGHYAPNIDWEIKYDREFK